MPITERINKFLGAFGLQIKASQSIPLSEGISGGDPFGIWQGSKKINAEIAMSLNKGWVYACVRAIAEEISNMDLRLYRVTKDGNEEVREHELLDLLEGVNPHMTGIDLRYQTGSHMELTGNAYWYLEGVKKESDKPTAIYPLNPKYIRIQKADLPDFVAGYEYRIGTKTRTFQPFEILHFKIPDPNDPYEGIGTLQAIMEWINSDNYATQVNLNYFKNGARLSGILESETFTTADQLEYIKRSFKQVYMGAENAYQVAALPKGVKYTSISDNPKDMDFANLQSTMRDKILAGFRVPKTILGTSESETNRATAETANYVFAARTIKPKMQLIVSYLNEFLVPRYGEDLFLDFVDPVPENRELEIQEMAAATGNSPILSPNEARERYFGEKPVKGGDALMQPFNLQPLGAPEKQTAPAKQTVKMAGTSKPTTRNARANKARKSMAGDIAKSIVDLADAIGKQAQEVKKKSITDLTDDEYEVIYKVFLTRVTPYQNALAAKVRDFNAQQKAEVQANLPKAVKTKAIDPADLFNKDTFVGALVDLATPVLTELYGKEGAAAAELIGQGGMDVLTPEVRKALKESIELMSNNYNDATLELLKGKLEQGISEGASLPELTDLVSQVYEFSDEVRAERVAETETFRVANTANKETWKQGGTVQTIKWYTAADERVCPWCAPQHGKVISIDENFYNKGDSVEGTDGAKPLAIDYTDIGSPPLHVSCRCYIRPEEIALAAPVAETKAPEPNLDEKVAEAVQKALAENKDAVKAELAEIVKQSLEQARVDITAEVKGEIVTKIDEALNNGQ